MQKVVRYLRHWFVPHESNNHRPRILHHQILFLVIIFFIALGLLLAPLKQSSPGVLGISYSISPSDLLTLTNQQRAANGLAPLTLNSQLVDAAQMKAQNMFAENYWAHFSPDGLSPWYWILKAGYQYNYAGENLARGFTSASDVVNAWMNSPGHRANMLSPNYTDVGFAIQEGSLTGEDTVLVVQEFGSKNSANEVASVNAPQTILPSASPAAQIVLTVTPSAPVLVVTQAEKPSTPQVAAVQSKPLINSAVFSKQLVFIIILFLLIALVIDIVIMQRKKVVRIVAHNADHIIFLIVILLILIFIIGKHFIL